MRIAYGSSTTPFVLEIPDGSVASAVSGLFPEDQRGSVPEAWGPSPEVPGLVVREAPEGFELTSPGDPAVHTVRTVTEVLAEIEFAVVGFLLDQAHDLTHLHAAGAVVTEGKPARAVLAVGDSGAGKSSLALAWSLAGLPLLGDDVVMIGDGGVARPFRRWLKVDRRRAREHGLPPSSFRDADVEGREVWYEPSGEAPWAGPGSSRPRVVALTRFVPGAGLSVAPLAASDGLSALMAAVLDTGALPLASFERLAAVADGAEVVDVVFGDPTAAAEALVERLG